VVPNKRWPVPFAAAVIALAATIIRTRARLLHVNEHDSHVVASRAARLARVPIVTHVRFRPAEAYCRWLFKSPYQPARLFFTSQTQIDDSAAAVEPSVPRTRWRLLPNGLDPSAFGPDHSARARLRSDWHVDGKTIAIGTACAISRRKRLDHFIRLVAKLKAAGVPVRGFIAGQPYFPEDHLVLSELRRLTASLDLDASITFLGYVEPIEPLYSAWDLNVSTSAYETFGMAVLEGMACQCPTVAYRGGAVAEVAGNGAVIVDDADEETLFRVALELCGSTFRRRTLADAGRLRAVSVFDIRPTTRQLAAEYRSVVSGF
jgi:glycosyltransferase involved in cell wall biosynthesis